jgi:hypothetical protein
MSKVRRLNPAPTPLSSPMAVFSHHPNTCPHSSRSTRASYSSAMQRAALAGADFHGMDRFYGHLLSIDAPHQERL